MSRHATPALGALKAHVVGLFTALALVAAWGCSSDAGTPVSGAGDATSADGSAVDGAGGAADGGASAGTPCSDHAFLDLSGAAGAGGDYAKPTLTVTCTDEHIIAKANTMISYTYVSMTPNPLAPVDETYRIPRHPKVADKTTAIPLLGRIGVAVNGVPLFGPNEGATPDNYADPVYMGIMDECGGHTAFEYHYHQFVYRCLTQAAVSVAEPWKLADPAKDKPWGIVGYAMDGFPIYGRYGCVDQACTQVVEFKSSYDKLKEPKELAWESYKYSAKSGAEYLDECNGRYGPDGTYRYHETADFPYGIACFRGTPNDLGTNGTRGGGGGGGGGQRTPTSCTQKSDCKAACPAGSVDCRCVQPPNRSGKVCVPGCAKDSDCPKGGGGDAMTCAPDKICVPSGGGPGGGGPGGGGGGPGNP